MKSWKACRNILVIRADNMGDLIMSGPAIDALKQFCNGKITVLTSSMGSMITPHIPAINETIVADVPWVKTNSQFNPEIFLSLINTIREKAFDAAVVFTVYSQNPLPAAMLALLAGIPKRLAYCRENPYELLTDWVPDKEPYSTIEHQVMRDIKLVESIGAVQIDSSLSLTYKKETWNFLQKRIAALGVNINHPWLIFHPGVSEKKREYPVELWIETAKLLNHDFQLLVTGASSEKKLASLISEEGGDNCFCLAGELNVEEFIAVIDHAPAVVSVNTGTIHIAAAVKTPVVVLYALTNPQHTPWRVPNVVFPFSVPKEQRSKNQVITYVNETVLNKKIPYPKPSEITDSLTHLISLSQLYDERKTAAL